MKNQPTSISVRTSYLLAGTAGVLLGMAFPPSPLYSLAYVSFFPLLWLYEHEARLGRRLCYSYLFLFVFHCVTLYWVGGFAVGKDIWMMVAGGALLLIHPIFYLPFLWLAFLAEKRGGKVVGYGAFISLWISFEYLHSLGEYAFPWITLGNSQAYDLARLQIAEYTSVYGLSFLILFFNVLLFELTRSLLLPDSITKKRRVVALSISVVSVYVAPYIYGMVRIENTQLKSNNELTLGLVQANIDPWEKWETVTPALTPEEQIDIHLEHTKKLASARPDLILWPETAVPIHIFLPRHASLRTKLLQTIDSLNVPVLTGLPTHQFFSQKDAPPTAEKIENSDLYVESYNSIALFEKNGTVETIYRKIVLVPFAERIPYAETFRFLVEPLKWNVGISSWGKGKDTVLFQLHTSHFSAIPFGALICYESIFPDYVREMVQRGGQFFVILTNDSWWGKTSGAYQHVAYASLRAIETRRWFVQAANGGISAIIDPLGRMRYKTELFQSTAFLARITPENTKTFYVTHGDVFAQSFLLISGIILLFIFLQQFRKGT